MKGKNGKLSEERNRQQKIMVALRGKCKTKGYKHLKNRLERARERFNDSETRVKDIKDRNGENNKIKEK